MHNAAIGRYIMYQLVPTVSQPACPSLGWDTIGVRYSHFHTESIWQLTALPKCSPISIKNGLRIFGCIIYKTVYRLTISTTNTKTTTKHSDLPSISPLCFSLCICLIVTSREFLVREQYAKVVIIWNLWYTPFSPIVFLTIVSDSWIRLTYFQK